MPERATVDRIDIGRRQSAIRDTASQDVALERGPVARYRPWIIGAVVLLLLGVLAAFTAPELRQWLGSDRSASREQLRLATVRRETFVRDVAAQGVVVAAVRPMLYAASAGTVTLHVMAGDAVEKGDLIATVFSPELANELQREQAALDGLETNIKRQAIVNRKLLLKSQQVVDLATLRLTAAERELRRAELSWERNAISKQDLEKARDDVASARIELGHAEQEIALDRESLDFELDTLRLERDRQRLAVDNLERRVAELELRAPVNGIVGTLAVDRRAVVPANAEIATVVDLSALEVQISVSDSYADDLAVGQPVIVRFAGAEHPATLVSISPEVINSTVSGRVRFDAAQPGGLRQNQRLSTRILLETKPDTLVVDSGAFYDSGGGEVIYRVSGNMAQRTRIQTGSRSVASVEILDGLSEGDQVIVSDIEQFRGARRVLLRN